jgi:hypothetical protein
LIERNGDKPLDTILMAQHTEVPQRVLTHQDISIVGWLQAIHGSNVTNAVVDDAIEVPLDELEGAFALGADWQNAPAER